LQKDKYEDLKKDLSDIEDKVNLIFDSFPSQVFTDEARSSLKHLELQG